MNENADDRYKKLKTFHPSNPSNRDDDNIISCSNDMKNELFDSQIIQVQSGFAKGIIYIPFRLIKKSKIDAKTNNPNIQIISQFDLIYCCSDHDQNKNKENESISISNSSSLNNLALKIFKIIPNTSLEVHKEKLIKKIEYINRTFTILVFSSPSILEKQFVHILSIYEGLDPEKYIWYDISVNSCFIFQQEIYSFQNQDQEYYNYSNNCKWLSTKGHQSNNELCDKHGSIKYFEQKDLNSVFDLNVQDQNVNNLIFSYINYFPFSHSHCNTHSHKFADFQPEHILMRCLSYSG